MDALKLIQEAWLRSGYPPQYAPPGHFAKVAEAVLTAFREGEEDPLAAGWQKAGVDFPFAAGHARYIAFRDAYVELAESAFGDADELPED